ncbi:YaaR family protein [Alkaliphilus sp. B6464]|uniref:YaaR family protein n=1 Tax=Alkaliphilus sp. B6464 TaxID=2731219 RepID=UPI001BAAEB9F|nr:YaaR family protein [Alkaliphilus sp. B6464]QUH18990.1 YaaR family protein [Alkaliphilus sp. B6464]
MDSIKGIGPVEMGNIVNTSNKRSEVRNSQFVEKFQNIKSEQVRDHLEKLFTQITAQSEKINEKLHLSEVIRYKGLVKEFLDVAVKNSHQFSKQNFLDRRGRHRVYSVVKNVDRELEAITKEFLNKEVDRLSIVKRLDDIRGMLLDVFM